MKPRKFTANSSQQIRAFLEYVLTRAVVNNEPTRGTLRVPYKEVIKPEPGMEDIKLIVKFEVYWDGDLIDEESEREKQ